jgi:phasin family protein
MINEQLAKASQASAASFFSLASQAFQGLEKLTALNLQVMKTSLAEVSASSQAATSVKSPQELFTLQASIVQAAPEKAIAYGRQVKEILGETSAAPRAEAEAKMAEVQAKFLDVVNGMLKNAPGSENTVALVKSAVAAANNAFEGVNKASKQVIDAVDANMSKLTETATKTARAARAKTGV